MWRLIVTARWEFSLFYAAFKKYSTEVIHVMSQPCRLIDWVAKDGWHHCKARCNTYGDTRHYYGGASNLYGSELVHGVMRPLDFQEARWLFLADGGGVDLFGGCQVFLHIMMWTVMTECDVGPRSGIMGPAGGLRGS